MGMTTMRSLLVAPTTPNGAKQLLEELAQEEVHVLFGTTPNGTFHLGNLLTLTQGFLSVAEAAQQLGVRARYTLAVNDLDPTLREGEGFLTLRATPTYTDRYFALTKISAELEKRVGEITLETFSETQARRAFRKALRSYYGQCYSVHTCGWATPLLQSRGEDAVHFPTREGIEQDWYRVAQDGGELAGCWKCNDIPQPFSLEERSLTVTGDIHLLIPLRDDALGVDIHLFGGDYNDQLLTFFHQQSARPVTYLRAPLLLGFDNEKMSASRGNLLPATPLLELDDWEERLFGLRPRGGTLAPNDLPGEIRELYTYSLES